jgi:hypothetical protein
MNNATVKNRTRTAVPAPASSQPGPARTGPARPARPPALASRPATSPQARTGTRTGPGTKPRTSTRPAARPAASSSPARLAAQRVRAVKAAGRRPVARTPFILLVLGLLGGGLICLLVINTTLSAASYRINALQQSNTQAAQRVQELQEQVATEESPSSIEQRALKLGLRIQPVLNFVDLRTGRSYTTSAKAAGAYPVPGYTP